MSKDDRILELIKEVEELERALLSPIRPTLDQIKLEDGNLLAFHDQMPAIAIRAIEKHLTERGFRKLVILSGARGDRIVDVLRLAQGDVLAVRGINVDEALGKKFRAALDSVGYEGVPVLYLGKDGKAETVRDADLAAMGFVRIDKDER